MRASRRPGWRLAFALLAFVLLAVAVPRLLAARAGATYGPGSGIVIGSVRQCPPAEDKASNVLPDRARFVTVSVQDQAGRTVASQRVPLRTSGVRYRMRLLAGAYFFNVVVEQGYNIASDEVFVTADEETQEDWSDSGFTCV
jgi:hypothetical protein